VIVRGVVRSAQGDPLEWVVVLFVTAPGEVPDIAAVTNDRGEFALTAHHEGPHRLGFRGEDHGYREIDIDVHDDIDLEVELESRP
jgi:hypothetical protein